MNKLKLIINILITALLISVLFATIVKLERAAEIVTDYLIMLQYK